MPRGNCYSCHKLGNMSKCSACQHALYCSTACQKSNWKKHKPNCLAHDHSLHELFEILLKDIFPAKEGRVAREYGFDNMRLHHADVSWSAGSSPMTAEQILLGCLQIIIKDICNLELGDTGYVFNSISVTKKMIVEACERNELDDFIHRYISNVFSRHGRLTPKYFSGWVWNRLVIGPTHTTELSQGQLREARKSIYYKYYGSTTPEKCCCANLNQEATVKDFMPYL